MAWDSPTGPHRQLDDIRPRACTDQQRAAIVARIRAAAPDLLPVLGLDTEETT